MPAINTVGICSKPHSTPAAGVAPQLVAWLPTATVPSFDPLVRLALELITRSSDRRLIATFRCAAPAPARSPMSGASRAEITSARVPGRKCESISAVRQWKPIAGFLPVACQRTEIARPPEPRAESTNSFRQSASGTPKAGFLQVACCTREDAKPLFFVMVG